MITAFTWFCIGLTYSCSTLNVQPSAEKQSEFAGGPYCGIYCVYSALNTFGKKVDFESLVNVKYVGNYEGSSLQELTRAVRDHGGSATQLHGLSASALRLSPCPLILHVKRPGLHTSYSHWVLYLGMSNANEVKLIDPPYDVANLPLAELLALWDGVALAVSLEPQTYSGFWIMSAIDHLIAIMLSGTAMICLYVYRKKIKRLYSQVLSLLVVALFVACCFHLFMPEGFWRNSGARGLVAGSHFNPTLPRLSTEELQQRIQTNSVMIVDARGSEAYEAFHLPGAVNLPIYAGLAERSALMAKLPSDRLVVVYCQSEACGWAEIIASSLVLRNRHQVAIYPEGVRGWIKQTYAK
jgi:rhodanese-related sulfurtransferase